LTDLRLKELKMFRIIKSIFKGKKMRADQLALGKYIWQNRQDKIARLETLNEGLKKEVIQLKSSLAREIALNAKIMVKGVPHGSK
jgi:hypothetical protein